jgi:hypothetical protein
MKTVMKHILRTAAVVFLFIGGITFIQSCEENMLTSNQTGLNVNSVSSVSRVSDPVVTVTDHDFNINSTGWSTQLVGGTSGSISTIDGPPTPPLGNGSVYFNAPDQKFLRLGNNIFNGKKLNLISKFSFSTYVENRDSVRDNIFVAIQIDTDNDGLAEFPLLFQPCYQSGKYVNHGHDQGPILLRTWQTWDLKKGMWFKGSFSGPFDDPDHGGSLYSLADWMEIYPDATLQYLQNIGGGKFSMRLSAGGPTSGANFRGNADNIYIKIDGKSTTFDFEKYPD